MKRMPQIPTFSAEYLRHILSYDPETGVFTWKNPPPIGKGRVGETAGFRSHQYILIGIKNRKYPAHRLAFFYMTGRWPIYDVDHKNTIQTDNAWINLREGTRSQNMANARKRSNNTSGIKGVDWDQARQKWRAQLSVNKRHLFLGRFDSKAQAAAAYEKAARMHYGEFART